MTSPPALGRAEVLLVGADFADEPLVSQESLVVLHVLDVDAMGEVLEREAPSAVVIRAQHLGIKDWLAIQKLRSRAPRTRLVLVTTARMNDRALHQQEQSPAEGATVILPWPSSASDLRCVLGC